MGKKYRNLGLEERERLAILRAEGKSLREIAKILGRSHSTLSRELRRHSSLQSERYYSPCGAQDLAEVKRRRAGRKQQMLDPRIQDYVEKKLKLGWSPELISGRLIREHPGLSVSHETIYRYVYDGDWELRACLPRQQLFRKRRSQRKGKNPVIRNRVPLAVRPASANQREELGHWESDSIVSSKNRVSLNVLVDRKSRYVQINKLTDRKAPTNAQAIIQRLKRYPASLRKTVTYDNGFENREHERINTELGTRSYFCAPYHSWEKGTVENTNGLIRRYIPKKTDLATISLEYLAFIENRLNNRPKKCLGYLTPSEVFNSFS